jgi:uncharacterized protein (TIGR02246 family)
MKTLMQSAIIAVALSAGVASAQNDADRGKIEAVIQSYAIALNASDTDKVMRLYRTDGVFMPQHSPSSIGAEAVRNAYDRVFKAIKLDVDFKIEEIVQIAPNWAFVRTNSAGFVTINATGKKAPEANQELFIFQKSDNNMWKIARYIFSTTNPPRQ